MFLIWNQFVHPVFIYRSTFVTFPPLWRFTYVSPLWRFSFIVSRICLIELVKMFRNINLYARIWLPVIPFAGRIHHFADNVGRQFLFMVPILQNTMLLLFGEAYLFNSMYVHERCFIDLSCLHEYLLVGCKLFERCS